MTGLGYLGVDMVIDRERGPLILEMNARPGLNIQIANASGLADRIRRIDSIYDTATSSHMKERRRPNKNSNSIIGGTNDR